jgi:methyl coenzyme M reductase subunit D
MQSYIIITYIPLSSALFLGRRRGNRTAKHFVNQLEKVKTLENVVIPAKPTPNVLRIFM